MTRAGPSLRPFEPSDLAALQRIRKAAFAPVFQSFRDIVGPTIAAVTFARADAEQAALLDDVCAAGSAHQVLVAEAGGVTLGFVAFTLDPKSRIGEIGLNAVHPDHAGRGLGSWMYTCVLERMREAGMVVASVSTGGDPSHAPARRAYAKAGFGPAIPSIHLYQLL
jgi:GNAT superfamily N-acetyltransferase